MTCSRHRTSRTFQIRAFLAALALSALSLHAQTNVATIAPVEAKPVTILPPAMTGDWGGWRTKLADYGFNLQVFLTGMLQGQAGGTDDSDDINELTERGTGRGPFVAGRVDALFELDTAKMGLWPGGSVHGHAEVEFGEVPGWSGGSLWPVNTAAITPLVDPGQVSLTSLFYRQRISDTTFMAGKINALDLLARDPFFGGWGIERFQNLALVANPNGITQLVMLGGSIDQKIGDFNLTALVFDPNNRTENTFDRVFQDGVNFNFSAQWNGKVWDRPSNLGVSYSFSTEQSVNLEDIYLASTGVVTSRNSPDSFGLRFGHQLWASPVRPGKGIGLYGRAAATQGSPNPIQWSIAGGITGEGMWASRKWDSFGVGIYHYGWSQGLSTALLTDVGPETGFEVFYNFAVTPWLIVTPDIQVIAPATAEADVFAVLGLRTVVKF